MQRVVLLGRSLRNERKVKVRMPLPQLTIFHRQQWVLDELKPLETYIREELNVKEVVYSTAEEEKVVLNAKPNPQLLGPRFGKNFGAVGKKIANLSLEQMLTIEGGNPITLDGDSFQPNEIQILRQARDGAPDVRSDRFISIELPSVLTEDLIAEGLAREVVHLIQQMRKDAGYQVEDRIAVTYATDAPLRFRHRSPPFVHSARNLGPVGTTSAATRGSRRGSRYRRNEDHPWCPTRRTNRHPAHRRAGLRPEAGLYDRHRHPQHAAGRPGLGHHGVLLARPAGRVPAAPIRSSRLRPKS